MNLFLRKINVGNLTFYLFFETEYCDVKLKIVDQDFNLFNGKIVICDFEKFSSKVKIEVGEFWDKSITLFKNKEEKGRSDIDIKYNDNKTSVTFVWKKVVADCLIKQQLGSVDLVKDESTDKFSVMDMVVKMAVIQEDLILDLSTHKSSLEIDFKETQKNLEEVTEKKKELEKELFSKFALLLNMKKKKIRELMDEVSSLRGKSDHVHGEEGDDGEMSSCQGDENDDGDDNDDSSLINVSRKGRGRTTRNNNNKSINKNNNNKNKDDTNKDNKTKKQNIKKKDVKVIKKCVKRGFQEGKKNEELTLSDIETESEDGTDEIIRSVKERRMNEGLKDRDGGMDGGLKDEGMMDVSEDATMDDTIDFMEEKPGKVPESSQKSGDGDVSGDGKKKVNKTRNSQTISKSPTKTTVKTTRASRSSKIVTTTTPEATSPVSTATKKTSRQKPNKKESQKWLPVEGDDLFF